MVKGICGIPNYKNPKRPSKLYTWAWDMEQLGTGKIGWTEIGMEINCKKLGLEELGLG